MHVPAYTAMSDDHPNAGRRIHEQNQWLRTTAYAE